MGFIENEYDELASRVHLIDNNTFMYNLEKLSRINEKAKVLYEELLELKSKEKVIPGDLTRDDFEKYLRNHYHCFVSGFEFLVYYFLCKEIFECESKELDIFEITKLFNELYELYKKDYIKFDDGVKKVCKDSSIYKRYLIPKVSKTNTSNKDIGEIPPVPKVPE